MAFANLFSAPALSPSPRVDRFPTDILAFPAHLSTDLFVMFKMRKLGSPAERDFQYWGGADLPWRNGSGDAEMDVATIVEEEEFKVLVEEDDALNASTERLHARGVRVDWLLALTFALNLWDWKTSQVVKFLVKPATEHNGRCRFADLPFVQPFTGPATVFMSHCWGGRWGDLVAAACSGARFERVVWLDVFAVRQWPGNVLDLDFRGIINRCAAVVVGIAPLEGAVATIVFADDGFNGKTNYTAFDEYIASDEYKSASGVLAFTRLWCIGESRSPLFWLGEKCIMLRPRASR
jgi:hypothetical protein